MSDYYTDKMNEHNVWYAKEGELDFHEVQEFKDEFTDIIADLRTQADNLESKLQDSVDELMAKLPKCKECGEILEEADDEYCSEYCETLMDGILELGRKG